MAFHELIKNFGNIRDYMREFYVYGFKSREEFTKKSARSYDNERRRIESYLGDYMGFYQTDTGKKLFISLDSRTCPHNPFYKALKAKSFTDKDITLHFILFDILSSPQITLSISQIINKVDEEYLSFFPNPLTIDESTIRKKLKEYHELGIIQIHRLKNQTLYSRTKSSALSGLDDMLPFFSEAGLCGVIGNYILQTLQPKSTPFSFKHHYITGALDSEILCDILMAISDKQSVTITTINRKSPKARSYHLVPLKLLVSVQTGRSYLAGYCLDTHKYKSYRLDYILQTQPEGTCDDFDSLLSGFTRLQEHMWGVVLHGSRPFQRVEFTLHIDHGEEHIYKRLWREKRCGEVERIDQHTCRFTAQVIDANEMLPWIRTFLGRMTSLHSTNRTLENQLRQDIKEMCRLYEMED